MDIEYDPIRKVVKTKDAFPRPFLAGGLGHVIYNCLKKHVEHGKNAQIEMSTGKVDSTKDFLSRCVRLAHFMKDAGIKSGDIISTCTNNHLNMYVPIVAAHFIGAIVASTDPQQTFEDTKHLVNLVKPKMCFVGKGSEEMIAKCIETLKIECQIIPFETYENSESFSQIMSQYEHVNEDDFVPYYVEDDSSPAVIFFTSGTTGLPKGAVWSHKLALAGHTEVTSPTPELRVLGVSGTYWSSAIVVLYLSCLKGVTMCISNGFDPATFWNEIEKFRVNLAVLAYTRTAEALKYLKKSLPALNTFFIMGGQMPYNFTAELADKLPNTTIRNLYGSTEASAIAPYEKVTKPKSCGVLTLNGQELKVVDPETEEPLGFNETGEIRIKSDYQFLGYYGQDSRDAWDSQGFYKTGDLGYYDEEFELFVVDRVKDIFKYKNWHISPIIIENALCSHEDVVLAFALGVPHPLDGNHIMAAVVLKENAKVTEEELLQFANGKLDDLEKIRAGVRIVSKDILPYTATGKVKRKALRDLLASQGEGN